MRERLKLLQARKNTCEYCEKRYHSRVLGIDHVFPKSKVKDAPIKVLACRSCNRFKGDLMPMVFIGKLEVIIANTRKHLGGNFE